MDAKQLRKALDTKQIHDLVGAYLLQKTFATVLREQVDAVYSQILQDIPVNIADKWTRRGMHDARITHQNDLYLCDDDALLNRIYDLADKQLKALGIKPADMPRDYCPALCAESDLSDIEHQIADVSGKPLDISADKLLCSRNGLDNYKKWIDLVVSAIVNLPNFQKPVLKGAK